MEKNYSVKEAARVLGYSMNSVYGFLKDGLIKSIRIGKGKFRIPQTEIDKFQAGRGASVDEVATPAARQDRNDGVVGVTRDDGKDKEGEKVSGLPQSTAKLDEREAIQNMQVKTVIVGGSILTTPRVGKSLADLSGESFLHTLKLWFEERVGFPTLFDWLTSLTSIVLGMSLFLYSNQLDILSMGRLSLWLNPIRLGMIFGGVGLILADMVQEEIGSRFGLTNIFRYLLAAAFFGLAGILFVGGDVDGLLIHGLFGLVILIEDFSGILSSTLYLLYIFGLLISVFIVYNFFPSGSGISMISTGLKSLLGSYVWGLNVFLFILLATGLYGYFWNKKFSRRLSLIYGTLLCVLALYYGTGNYWSRSFATLIAGFIGILLPYWDTFKARLYVDRTLVYRLFGSILMCFGLVIILITVVQGTLLSNAYRNIFDKAEYAEVEVENTIDSLKQGLTDLSKNKGFIASFNAGKSEEIIGQLRYLSLGRTDVAITGAINAKGKAVAVYPSMEIFSTTDFSRSDFFISAVKTGTIYVSSSLESLTRGVDNVWLIAVPTVDAKNVVSGVLVTALSGVNMSTDLQRIGQSSLGQEVSVIGIKKIIAHPEVSKLGSVLPEADGGYELWMSDTKFKEGYNWNGVHSLFASSKAPKYNLTIVVSEPMQKVLNISSSRLSWALFLFLIMGITVLISFVFIDNSKERGGQ